MTDTFFIFVDAKAVEATRGQSVIDAIAAAAPDIAERVRAGERVLTDSRGLPTDASSPAFAGAIFRVVSARAARAAAEGPTDE